MQQSAFSRSIPRNRRKLPIVPFERGVKVKINRVFPRGADGLVIILPLLRGADATK